MQLACAEALFDWKEPDQADDLFQAAILQHGLAGRLVNGYVRTLVSTYRLDALKQVKQQCNVPYPPLQFEVLEAKCLIGLNRWAEAIAALQALPMQFSTAYLLCQIYRHLVSLISRWPCFAAAAIGWPKTLIAGMTQRWSFWL